jgi:preprotein translocase SecE subunit
MADARSERHPAVSRGGSRGGGSTEVEERRKGHFVQESWAELKKVEWPGQNQVIQGTVVVLVACIVVGTYLYVNDFVWKHVVSKVFLGQ